MCQLIGQFQELHPDRHTWREGFSHFSVPCLPVSSILCPHSLCESPSRTSHLVSPVSVSTLSHCYSKSMRAVPLSKCARAPQETFRALYAHFRKSAFLHLPSVHTVVTLLGDATQALKENCIQRSMTREDSLRVTG